MVRKLEEGLYRSALSREQYGDSDTLEARVQSMVRQLMGRGGGAVGEAGVGTDVAAASSVAADLPPPPWLSSYSPQQQQLEHHSEQQQPHQHQMTASMLASVSPLPASMLPGFWWHHGLPTQHPWGGMETLAPAAVPGPGPFMALGFPYPSLSSQYL